MLKTTAGQLFINEQLPPDLRDYSRVLDKKGAQKLLQLVSEKYPEKYKEIAKGLFDVGHFTAYYSGGQSFGLHHLRTADSAKKVKAELEGLIQQIMLDPKLSEKEKEEKLLVETYKRQGQLQEDVYNESLAKGNPLADQVKSGSRGNQVNLKTLIGADGLYQDHHDNLIPIPVLNSYSAGLSPVEYWAGTFGARKGVADVKFATQDAGFFSYAKGTEVRLADDTICNIEDIKVGDMVLGADMTGKTFPVRVTNVFYHGLQEIWRYKFRVGKARKSHIEIEATEQHKVLAQINRGRKNTKHGDKNSIIEPTKLPLSRASAGFNLIAEQGRHSDFINYGENHPWALLLGLILGDGCISGHNITLSSADPSLITFLNEKYHSDFSFDTMRGHIYEYLVNDLQPLPYTHDSHIGNKYASGFRHRLRAWFSSLGLLGQRSFEKFIPNIVFTWNNEAIAELIAGIIETDGCVSAIYPSKSYSAIPSVILAMTARDIVEKVKYLLSNRFGIHSSIVRQYSPNNKKILSKHDMYNIIISERRSIRRFAQVITLPGRKAVKLKELLAKLDKPKAYWNFNYPFIQKDYLGYRDTYDLEVDHPDHLFVLANGAIGSNSKQLNQLTHRLLVTANDSDDPDHLHNRGLPVDVDDPDNEGGLLAADYGPYKRNTIITPKIMSDLKEKGLKRILARSPVVSGSPEGGVYANDVGIRERGGLAPLGDNVGIAASQALCLVEGTEVRMADGSIKLIEKIEPGETVFGCSIDGIIKPVKVIARYDNGIKPIYETTFKTWDDQLIKLQATLEHKILCVELDHIRQNKLDAELKIASINPSRFLYARRATGDYAAFLSQEYIGELPTYDLEVEHSDHLFLLENFLVVSNSEPLSQAQLCVAGGTLVRMADWSVKPIEKIQVGEFVIGSDRDGNTFPVQVINTYDNGEKECVRTIFNVASSNETVELISTKDHKLLATARYWDKGYITDILPVNKKCIRYSAEMTKSVTYSGGTPEPYALLLGLLLGDGCYTTSVHGVHLSCFDPTLIEEIQPYLNSLGLKSKLLAGQKGYHRISQIKDTIRQDPETGRTLPGDRNPVLVKLKSLQMYGKYAHDKQIPEEVWSWDQESVKQLIAGLFVTDGSLFITAANKPRNALYIGYGSTSLPMIQQLKELLRVRFAIHAGKINATNSGRKRTLYSFVIARKTQVMRFLNTISLYGIKRQLAENHLNTFKLANNVDGSFYHRKLQIPIGRLPTYDIEVDHPDHLYTLGIGLIQKNSSKHSGGIAGAAKGVSGFKYVNQLVQVPKHFKGGAAHSQVDGTVEDISEAPAGGHYVTINGQRHYVGAGFDLKVQPKDTVEAGDVISEGIPNPAEVVKHKGIGEGRRYFMNAFREAYKDAGIGAHRRNIEVLTRGLINHVRMHDEYKDYVPDDVVQYNFLEHQWTPREGAEELELNRAHGKYLEKPVLHYTIGTKIRPSVTKELKEFGINKILVHNEEPPFHPEMIRGMANLAHDPDWMTRMLGSNLQKSLLDAVHRGAVSDEHGTSYVPSLARAVEFGRRGLVRDWHDASTKFKTTGKVIP